jgi:hypothetical protein
MDGGMTEFPPPVHRVRVRYCETDRMAIAHHGSYVAWFEEARTEWLRQRGKTYRQMEDEGNLLQVVEFVCRYHKPVDYDEVVADRRADRRTGQGRGRARVRVPPGVRRGRCVRPAAPSSPASGATASCGGCRPSCPGSLADLRSSGGGPYLAAGPRFA